MFAIKMIVDNFDACYCFHYIVLGSLLTTFLLLTFLTACMFLGPGINAAVQRTNELAMTHLQLSYRSSVGPINNVEVKNIESTGCASLTQLQRKLLHHLYHM